LQFIKGDIQSPDLLNYILHQENIDTVLHFAAQTHVDNSFGNSLTFTMNNTFGTHVLLESCRLYEKIKRFINVSTDEVYGETSLEEEKGLNESSRLDPTNPYSAAKAGAEMLALAYSTSYKMPIITTRGNNVSLRSRLKLPLMILLETDSCPFQLAGLWAVSIP
jgi:dTDP-D-glucose 4,6-dehydratase